MIVVYGIPNCDTVRRARAWLNDHAIAHDFVDYKKAGADPARLAGWIDRAGTDRVLNRAGTTFRKLDAAQKDAAASREGAIAIMVEHPSTIRRPVVEADGLLLVGFDPAAWKDALLPEGPA